MKLNDEHTLLSRFCGNDEYRPSFWNPFYDEHLEVVCATDAHCLIFGDKELFINEYKPLEKPIGLYNVIPVEEHTNRTISLSKLQEFFDKVPYTKKHECPECGGTLKVHTDYEAKTGGSFYIEIECPVCDGTGEVIGDEQKDQRYMLRIEHLCFAYKLIYVLAKTMEELKVETIKVLALRDLKLYVELLPGLKALFMSKCKEEELFKGADRFNPDLVIQYKFD